MNGKIENCFNPMVVARMRRCIAHKEQLQHLKQIVNATFDFTGSNSCTMYKCGASMEIQKGTGNIVISAFVSKQNHDQEKYLAQGERRYKKTFEILQNALTEACLNFSPEITQPNIGFPREQRKTCFEFKSIICPLQPNLTSKLELFELCLLIEAHKLGKDEHHAENWNQERSVLITNSPAIYDATLALLKRLANEKKEALVLCASMVLPVPNC